MHLLARSSLLTGFFLLSAFTYRLWRNLRFVQRARAFTRVSEPPPRVSVLVPARDEARNIVACVESLACQEYPNFEVIVLDDHSTDGTGALLDGLAARHPNVTVVHGDEEPPVGWNGKSYACFRLAAQATGDWLLFTDADTRHAPTSIAMGIAQAEGLGAALLSAFPAQLTGSWSERLLVSYILDFLPLLAIDLAALWRGDTASSAANGQYILVRAATYRAIGGHEAISQALLDDFALARQVRARGYTLALVDGTSLLSCRMYRSAGEVWQGFTRSILLALETSSAEKRSGWWAALFAWGYACVFILPFYRALFSAYHAVTSKASRVDGAGSARRADSELQHGDPAKSYGRLSLVLIAWLMGLRAIVSWRFARPWSEVAATPLAGWSVMVLGLGAIARRVSGKRVRWKGRDYADSR